MKSSFSALIAVYFLSFAAFPASAADISVDVRFSIDEASIIRDYFRQNPGAHQSGKKRGKTLPPGIARNLARGKALPPGLAKQVLPAELLRRLPPAHDGFDRIVVDGKVLLVEIATQVIHDVLADAILK